MLKKTVFAMALMALSGSALAVDINVPGDQATIADALAVAVSGDRIVLTQDAAPYPISNLIVNEDITIEAGAGLSPVLEIVADPAPITTNSQAGSIGVGFLFPANVAATLRGFTIDGSNNVAGLNPPVPTVVINGGTNLTFDGITFLNATSRAIDGRQITGAITLTVTNCVFDGSGNRTIQLNNISGGTSVVDITDSVFTGAEDDAIALRNAAVWDARIERNIFHTPGDPIDADAIQIGGGDGTEVLIRDNIIYNWGDDAIQLENNGPANFVITRNTFYNVGTGVNVDVSFQGTITFTQNIIAEWDQSRVSPKGFAVSDSLGGSGTWSFNANVFFDAEGTQINLGAPTAGATGAGNATGTNVASLFISTNPADPDFLKLAPGSAAINVAGTGLDAGALQLADVNDWLMY